MSTSTTSAFTSTSVKLSARGEGEEEEEASPSSDPGPSPPPLSDRHFPVLPGAAFEPLKDEIRSQLFHFTFEQNKKTPDSAGFVIPDQVEVQRVLNQRVDMVANVIDTMDEYSKTEGSGIGADGEYKGVVASFGSDHEAAKERILMNKASLTSTVARVHQYDLMLNPISTLADYPKLLISSAMCAIEYGDETSARELLSRLIGDFGSSYLSHIQLGYKAKISDYISESYAKSKDEKTLAQEAKFSFFGLFSIGDDSTTKETVIKEYSSNIVHSHADVVGCGAWVPHMSYEEWSKDCVGGDALLGGQSTPIYEVINPAQFPGVNVTVVERAYSLAQQLVRDLIHINTYVGCLNATSTRFSPWYNVHDQLSCIDDKSSSVMGGFYSTCRNNEDDLSCKSNNFVTDSASCPEGYEDYIIYSDDIRQLQVCTSFNTPETRMAFGGTYTKHNGNALAGDAKQCPFGYDAFAVEVGELTGYNGLTFCLKPLAKYETVPDDLHLFGFYSCNEGNKDVYTGFGPDYINPSISKFSKRCSGGYGNVLIDTTVNGEETCPLWYCMYRDDTSTRQPAYHAYPFPVSGVQKYGHCHASQLRDAVAALPGAQKYLGRERPDLSPLAVGTQSKPAGKNYFFADNFEKVQNDRIAIVIEYVLKMLQHDTTSTSPSPSSETRGERLSQKEEVESPVSAQEVAASAPSPISGGAVAAIVVCSLLVGVGMAAAGVVVIKKRGRSRRGHRLSSGEVEIADE
eukprot:CAMPEP_0113919138 /NCGR_PEP_ID=MMETSP0780_2-20120614/33752_1 /TAXON_ID=652834 /ORGANISM="Palpitomonas bilix" /LENGTH=741 /DNA_ID=CAMNT_0000919047 /DNA_START=469 /DNA_END=2694 /DNA_ORIENTATION=- /assembly_acc=CAM_ASM_000599